MKKFKKMLKKLLASTLVLSALVMGGSMNVLAQEPPSDELGLSTEDQLPYLIKDEIVQNPDGTFSRNIVRASRPPITTFSDGNAKGTITVSTSSTHLSGGASTKSTLSMVVKFTFDNYADSVKVNSCTVDIDNQTPGITYKKGSISTSTGKDWFSGSPYIKKTCGASGKDSNGKTHRFFDVWIQVYADGGYKTN